MIPEIFLAPMAGFTDAATREIAYEFGANIAISEMISANGLAYGNTKTNSLLKTGDDEKKLIIQLFGNKPEILADAAQKVNNILQDKLYGIDINMGCPAPKIVKNGEGCALMRDLDKAKQIINCVRKAYNGILSVKFRKGFDNNNINAVELAKIAQDAGCDFVTVHGRTREQYYGGSSDWKIIKDVNSAVNIPVVANGDIFTASDAKKIKALTGCKSIMIGRGALGNPYIFREIVWDHDGLNYTPPSSRQIIELCLRHAKKEIQYKNEKTAMLSMRTLAPKYVKGLKQSAKVREKLVRLNKYDELENILYGYLDQIEKHTSPNLQT